MLNWLIKCREVKKINSKPIFNSYIAKQLVKRGHRIVDLQPNNRMANATIFYFKNTDEFIKDLKDLTKT